MKFPKELFLDSQLDNFFILATIIFSHSEVLWAKHPPFASSFEEASHTNIHHLFLSCNGYKLVMLKGCIIII